MRSIFAIGFFLIVSFTVGAETATHPILPLKEVQPGMTGECRTVFSGTNIQTFPFEVMDVAHDFAGPGRDIIWCRMKGDPTGQMVVAAGMSGSPCYINGKQIGALAYGWPYNKDPVFGVQPIESMLELLEFKGNARSAPPYTASNLKQLHQLSGFALPNQTALMGESLRPLPLPVEISGLHPSIQQRIFDGFKEAGFHPMAGSGGGTRSNQAPLPLEPGSPVTGIICRGDLNIAATGTVSWREGNRILAFGHPFLAAGSVEIPMGNAEIIGVVSSYAMSFKMANKGGVVGSLIQDRSSGVYGEIGRMTSMVPMSVRIIRPESDHTWNLEFTDNAFFSPLVYQSALMQFLSVAMETTEAATLKLKVHTELEGAPPLEFNDWFSGQHFSWVEDAVISSAKQFLPLYFTPDGNPKLRRIVVEAEITPGQKSWRLMDWNASRTEVQPGDDIELTAHFEANDGSEIIRTFPLHIPKSLHPGQFDVVAADASTADVIKDLPTFESLFMDPPAKRSELIKLINQKHSCEQLYVFIIEKSPGLRVANQSLSALPGSVRKVLQSSRNGISTTPINLAVIQETSFPLEHTLRNSSSLTLIVP